jgi:hypothetical protein
LLTLVLESEKVCVVIEHTPSLALRLTASIIKLGKYEKDGTPMAVKHFLQYYELRRVENVNQMRSCRGMPN